MNRAHKIKLKPNKAQSIMLAKTAGTARYAYNWRLAKWNELYEAGEKCSAYGLMKLWKEDRPDWALEVGVGYRGWRCVLAAPVHALGRRFQGFLQRCRQTPHFSQEGDTRRLLRTIRSVQVVR